ncbi:MAG: exodeoxyribonuclease VII large subunit [Paludibacteraceae bacterium]|nr:exodeoxyribonuclease VII large subunit [Paludibacteraceae bacterium]
MVQSYSLYELLETVSLVISDALPDSYWVRAEVSSLSAREGAHCYMELVEAQKARVRANCWRQTWQGVNARFIQVTGRALQPGMQIMAKVSVEMHTQYGLSLTIHDIDPYCTLGDIAKKRQEDIKRLEENGLTKRQQELRMASLPKRIAIISSSSAAGYQDFVHQLTSNAAGYTFSLTLFEAAMQGDTAAASIADALARIRQNETKYDLVVMIRGGGSTTDLSCFDDYALAALCAVFPLPVLTGIGHTRDVSLVDMVAFSSLKTPTAVAEFLIARFDEQAAVLQELSLRLVRTATLQAGMRRAAVEHLYARLLAAGTHRIRRERMMMDMLEKSIQSQSPEYILRKGYTLVVRDGKVLRRSVEVSDGDVLTIEWSDGKRVVKA